MHLLYRCWLISLTSFFVFLLILFSQVVFRPVCSPPSRDFSSIFFCLLSFQSILISLIFCFIFNISHLFVCTIAVLTTSNQKQYTYIFTQKTFFSFFFSFSHSATHAICNISVHGVGVCRRMWREEAVRSDLKVSFGDEECGGALLGGISIHWEVLPKKSRFTNFLELNRDFCGFSKAFFSVHVRGWGERETLNTMCKYLWRMENAMEPYWEVFQFTWRCCRKNLDSRAPFRGDASESRFFGGFSKLQGFFQCSCTRAGRKEKV